MPWELEAGGTYRPVYGEDADDDGVIDTVVEQREFVFPQHGSPNPARCRTSAGSAGSPEGDAPFQVQTKVARSTTTCSLVRV